MGQRQLLWLGASTPASAAPGSEKSSSLSLDSHWTWCQGQRAAQESFPAPTLWQGGSEEAEQQALCYTVSYRKDYPASTLARSNPLDNCEQGQKFLGKTQFLQA